MNHKIYSPLKSVYFAPALLVLSSMATVHAESNPISAKMYVFQIVDASNNSKKQLKETDQVKPNSVLEYRVDYSNNSANDLKNLKLNLPLPKFVTYTGHSLPKDTYASLDGKVFAKAPLTRVENGKKVNIPLSEYRVLQWNVRELKPKQKFSVSAQVRVNTSK